MNTVQVTEKSKSHKRRRKVFGLIALILVMPMLINCANAPGYRGPKSDHFDGSVFKGRKPLKIKFVDLMKWKLLESAKDWPTSVDVLQKEIPEEWLKSQRNFVTFINHATVFIQWNGTRILTDPVYSERSSPVTFAGPKRVRRPGVAFDKLPKIDLVLISHNHYDHLDIATLKKLAERDNPMILSGLGNSLLLKQNGLHRCHDMDWNDEYHFNNLQIDFVYCQHWSARGLSDRNKTLWGSFVVQDQQGKAIYFAGDTGYSEHFAEQGKKYSNIELALLPIGAYEPRWFMKYQHMNPADAVKAHLDLNAKQSMGIHFGTFQLTNEGINEPESHLKEAMRQTNLPEEQFFVPKFGESYEVKKSAETPRPQTQEVVEGK